MIYYGLFYMYIYIVINMIEYQYISKHEIYLKEHVKYYVTNTCIDIYKNTDISTQKSTEIIMKK
jgi:hypothetical protein